MVSSYVPLHLRSNCSLLTGTARVEEIVERGRSLGLPALALTDVNNLYGAVPFYKLSREAGLKPIIGVEITASPTEPCGPAVLLARNLAGYSNLCRIITRRNLSEQFDLAATLVKFQDGLFILTEDAALAETLAGKMDRESLWLELAFPGRLRTKWRGLAECARRLGIGVVATPDAYFLDRGDHELHRMLSAVRENCLVSQVPPGRLAHGESFLPSSEEMAGRFRDYPEALANTLEIARRCGLEIPMGKPIFPNYPLPAGETPYSFLYRRCLEGISRRYRPVSQPLDRLRALSESRFHRDESKRPAVERMTSELAVIDRLGFSGYFVVVGDIVAYARKKGIPVVGRGSGASSIVAYLLGITNVDPLRFNLPFERFLNEGRTDCPDLDIDLCWRLRDEVIRHVYDTYGADRVAMISTHNSFRRRSAFRELAKASGLANGIVNRMSRRMSCADTDEAVKELTTGSSDVAVDDETLRKIVGLARRIEGFPRHLGIHCGGIVISDRTIDSYVPLEEAAKGIAITQYEMHAIEDIGLVKIDLLGNRALSTIRETVEILKRDDEVGVDPETLGEDDAATFELVRSGRTLGCCQLESPAMRHLLQMLKPQSVTRIIQALALIRPAPASIGMKETFVRRARGLEPIRFPHPSLEDILGDTCGIMLYEDDAMLIASRLAGLSLEEGDRLRKAIRKSRSDDELRRVSRHFLQRASSNGVPLDVAKEMWIQMAKFNEYSFCRAHAAGYGLVAYRSAYLKAHHGSAYMTAALNNVRGIYPGRVHLWEAKRMGIEVLSPCVNHSGVEFTHEDGKIRVGLSRVKDLGVRTMEGILEGRDHRPFRTLRDFMSRVPAGLSELENLVLAGGFDFTGRNRPEIIWQTRAMFAKVKPRGKTDTLDALEVEMETPRLPDYSLEQKVDYELKILECPLSAHPVELIRNRLRRNGRIESRQLPELIGRYVQLVGILDATRGNRTRNGELMQFLTLEDETGVFEVTLFPKIYRRVRQLLSDGGPYLVEGKVEDQYDSISVTARRLERFAENRQ